MIYKNRKILLTSCVFALFSSIDCMTVIKNETNGDIEITGSVDMSEVSGRATGSSGQMIKKISAGSQITIDSCYTISVSVKVLNGSAAGQTCSVANTAFMYPNQNCPCDVQIRVYITPTNVVKTEITHFKSCSSKQ